MDRTVIAPRDVAEEGAWAVLARLAVNKPDAFPHTTAEQQELRVKKQLRATTADEPFTRLGGERKHNYCTACLSSYFKSIRFTGMRRCPSTSTAAWHCSIMTYPINGSYSPFAGSMSMNRTSL